MSPSDGAFPSGEQTLVRRLRHELGEYLYLTLVYRDETSELLYVSAAAKRVLRRSDERITESHPAVAKIRRCCTEGTARRTLPFGDHRCSLLLYDEWLLLHYREPSSGVIIGVDAASASNLRDFLADVSPVVTEVLSAR
ncbi:hypothetical protein ABNG02_09730 [Halorubrum ejinorense]|uniref:Uncharacterized protein n=1 Tax=Halorubrum ejinorense TaxID=425309 RepID=A0AAV3SN82_9EURY